MEKKQMRVGVTLFFTYEHEQSDDWVDVQEQRVKTALHKAMMELHDEHRIRGQIHETCKTERIIENEVHLFSLGFISPEMLQAYYEHNRGSDDEFNSLRKELELNGIDGYKLLWKIPDDEAVRLMRSVRAWSTPRVRTEISKAISEKFFSGIRARLDEGLLDGEEYQNKQLEETRIVFEEL